jgi:hypothetical protein
VEEVLDRTRCVFGKEMEMEVIMYRVVVVIMGNREREVVVERDLILTGRVSFRLSTHLLSCVVICFFLDDA